MTIAASSYGWRITFDYDPMNDHIQMDTLCYADGHLVWQAVDHFPIEPGATSMQVRRHATPSNALCNISVFLFREGSEDPVESAGIVD
jgi:hypothetical protein